MIFPFLALGLIFFLTSIISVVTGSTSLITVPALFQAGIDPRVAVATNMFALIFMSIGGAVPFLKSKAIDRKRLPALLALTALGSIIGVLLLLIIASTAVPLVISVAMIAVAIFSVVKRDAGTTTSSRSPSPNAEMAGYIATFLLGIYGGFFSGGYVTLLTAVYVAFFGMTFVEAVATTKVINIVSLIATGLFMTRGIVNYELGIVLGILMFFGAMIGSHIAVRINNMWLRRIFLATVIILALKTLLVDVLGTMVH